MELQDLTQDNFIEVLGDAGQRKKLLAALRKEEGYYPPLINHCWKLAETCRATPEKLRHVTHELMKLRGKQGDYDSLLCLLVRHPEMPSDLLAELLDQKRCICDLGHLPGPQWLLERLAKEENYSEAIVTLALRYYSQDNYDASQFTEFLKQHQHNLSLKSVMTHAKSLPDDKWQIVYEIFKEDNRVFDS